jgi:plastocyanin
MPRSNSPAITVILTAVLLAVLLGVTACASQTGAQGTSAGTQPMQAASQGQAAGGMAKMTCPMCNKGAPAPEAGAATVENGVQVVKVSLKEGYYSPNEITVKAGTPVKLVFSGQAKDCSGKPKIAALNQQVDFTKTGEATMDLGVVSAGTYELTCGMGSAGGHLIVQ